MNESNHDDALQRLLATSERQQFAPGFTDRATARWRAATVPTVIAIDDVVARVGRRALPWLAAAAALTAMVDWRLQVATTTSTASAATVEVAQDATALDDLQWSAYQ